MERFHSQKKESRTRSRLLSFFPLLLALLLSVRPAAAHSEGAILRLSNAPAGPYTLSVWTYPGYLLPGTIHFSVSVLDAATNEPLPATAVSIQVTPIEEVNQPLLVSSRAQLDYQTLLHETNLEIPEPGNYQVTVQAAASAEQQGQAAFDLEVVSGAGYRLMIIGFMLITIVTAVWFVREGFKTWGIERWLQKKSHTKRRFSSSPPT